MRVDIKQECQGRWAPILTNLGINAELFSGKHQPCLFCGGKDRARWDRQKEFYYCSQCGSKQPIDMAIEHTGLSFKETTNLIRPNVMNSPLKIVKPVDTQQNEARIKKIHAGLKRITPDSVVALYLAKRGIKVLPDADCYQHDAVEYWQDGEKSLHPAMVSVFRTPTGEVATYHITYLSADGTKADVQTPRKVLPVIHSLAGASIRLFKAEDVLAITEGVETALCVTEDSGVPCWAAGSAQAMNNIVIPESVKTVWIYADSDESFTGQKAAYDLANRLKVKEGKTVRVVTLIDQRPVEDYGVKYDFNDYAILKANS
jgi:putative DNA primase/helicase